MPASSTCDKALRSRTSSLELCSWRAYILARNHPYTDLLVDVSLKEHIITWEFWDEEGSPSGSSHMGEQPSTLQGLTAQRI